MSIKRLRVRAYNIGTSEVAAVLLGVITPILKLQSSIRASDNVAWTGWDRTTLMTWFESGDRAMELSEFFLAGWVVAIGDSQFDVGGFVGD
jgi:hypothetical protein